MRANSTATLVAGRPALAGDLDLADEWFAIQVRAGREPVCATHLRARGYDVLSPSYHERRRWSDRIKVVERALFAGYIFCRTAPTVTAKIVTTPGVIRIVGNRNGPLAVKPDEIEAIQRIVDTERPAEPFEYLRHGDRVRVERGPLRDLEGIVVMVRNRHRLIVSVSLLQRSVAVEIDPDWVTVSPERAAAARLAV